MKNIFPSQHFFIVFSLLLGFFLSPAHAAFETSGTGARARSMGGAFTAMPDDFSAIYWNPAALPFAKQREVSFSYENRFNLGLVGENHLAIIYPKVGPGGIGISWTRLATTRKVPDFKYSENTYTFSYGMNVRKGLSIGSTLNFYRLVSEADASAYGVNLACRYNFKDTFFLGANWLNVGQTTLRYETGAQDPLPRDVRVGASIHPSNHFRISFDVDQLIDSKTRKHSGFEWLPMEGKFALRAGASQKEAKGSEWVPTLGTSLHFMGLSLDYGFENHFDLGSSHIFTIRALF